MITNIEIELSPYFDSTSPDKRICAESIMEMIEKAGMLPPRIELPKLGISDNAWEPEE
jgi:hypothetical protein